MRTGFTVTGAIMLIAGIIICAVTRIFEILAWGALGALFSEPLAFYGGIAGIALAIVGLVLLIVGLASKKPQN